MVVSAAIAAPSDILSPFRDGTLVDGVFGTFDGTADRADYFFNGSSFEGSITRTNNPPQEPFEYRVFWEFSLSDINATAPLTAHIAFALRGATVFGLPDAEVCVFSYPSDLQESFADYSLGPASLVDCVIVPPLTAPPVFTLNVSNAVNQALLSNKNSVAFRFQINPDSPNTTSQAFIDANEDDPASKPVLTLIDQAPGDWNDDGYLDLADYSYFPECMNGPTQRVALDCEVFDLDLDGDVDHLDLSAWLRYQSALD